MNACARIIMPYLCKDNILFYVNVSGVKSLRDSLHVWQLKCKYDNLTCHKYVYLLT